MTRRFDLLKRLPRLGRMRNRVIWVEGYVCALEDVVKGLEHQIQMYAQGGHNDTALDVLDTSLLHVQAVLKTAQDTLTYLQALEKEIPRD